MTEQSVPADTPSLNALNDALNRIDGWRDEDLCSHWKELLRARERYERLCDRAVLARVRSSQ